MFVRVFFCLLSDEIITFEENFICQCEKSERTDKPTGSYARTEMEGIYFFEEHKNTASKYRIQTIINKINKQFMSFSLFFLWGSMVSVCVFVGKIVQQFFKHDFPVRHSATTKRNTYRSCLVCDTCIRELIVLDVPLQVRND